MKLCLLACAILLTGCTSLRLWVKPEPFDVHTSPLCSVSCDTCTEVNPITVTASPDSAIDAAKAEHMLRQICAARVTACDQRRQACEDALQRARDAKAIQ